MRGKYEELNKEAEGFEEWKKYREVFRGIENIFVEDHQERIHHQEIETRYGGWRK